MTKNLSLCHHSVHRDIFLPLMTGFGIFRQNIFV